MNPIRSLFRNYRRRRGTYKATTVLLVATTVFLLLWWFVHVTWVYNSPQSNSIIGHDRLLQVSKCPACYGTEICPFLTDHHLNPKSLNGTLWSQFTSYVARNWFNVKNVYYAMFNGKKVVLKKLAHNWEFTQFDNAVLELRAQRMQKSYNDYSKLHNIGAALKSLVTEVQMTAADEYTSLYRLLTDVQSRMATAELSSDAIYCKSGRFLQLALQKYTQNYDNVTDRISNLLTSLLINAEPVIMRVFSDSSLKDRFPKYLGSCGRMIVVNYVGVTLDHYRTTPWPRRLRLALDLLRFAKQMTANSLNMNLYWTDVSFENFAVTAKDRVVLVDVEGIVLVDRNSTNEQHDLIHTNPFGNDYSSEGLQFSLDDLCSYRTTDHNIYAVCKV